MGKVDDMLLATRAAVFKDKRAFGELVTRHHECIRRFFLTQTLGDESLSDDLAQDTFVKAWLNIGVFRGTAAFSTWLYRIAFNTFYDYKRGCRHTACDIDSSEVRSKTSVSSSADEHMDLYRALEILTPQERTCVMLRLMEGHSIKRISTITNMAEGTVKSHVHRGKEKLVNYLKQNGYGK